MEHYLIRDAPYLQLSRLNYLVRDFQMPILSHRWIRNAITYSLIVIFHRITSKREAMEIRNWNQLLHLPHYIVLSIWNNLKRRRLLRTYLQSSTFLTLIKKNLFKKRKFQKREHKIVVVVTCNSIRDLSQMVFLWLRCFTLSNKWCSTRSSIKVVVVVTQPKCLP